MNKDYPDNKLAKELNEKYGEDNFDNKSGWVRKQKRRSRLIQVAAALFFIFFALGVLGRALQLFTWPSLDFLHDSLAYLQEPHIREYREAVVELKVEVREPGKVFNTSKRGTGFNISEDGIIVTNRHVVEHAQYVTVAFPGSGKYIAGEILLSDTFDLAVIQLEDGFSIERGKDQRQPLPFLNLNRDDEPSTGDRVTVIGNPLQMSRIVVKGQVVGYRESSMVNMPGIMKIDAPIHPGNSGSPVIDDNGLVVGIVFAIAGSNTENRLGLAVPSVFLTDLLNKQP